MSMTLWDLVYRTAVELGVMRTGTATGGGLTTLVDTNGLRLVDNDYYNEGTLFVRADAGGPINISKTFYKVKDFNSTSKTVTVYDTLPTEITVDDTYGISNPRYPLDTLIQKINNALILGGDIPVEDTSLETVEGQLVYDLPDGAVARDLRQVLVSTSKTDGQPHYRPVVNWSIRYADAGSAGDLELYYPLQGGYTLLLRYAQTPTEMSLNTSVLHDAIHPDRIVYQACVDCLRWYKDKTRMRHLKDTIEMMEFKADRARERHPLPPLPSKQAKITVVSRTLEIGSTWAGRYSK